MIHITKTKSGKIQVVIVGENGEPLSTSELLNSKQSAWKNIFAQAKVFMLEGKDFYAQDDTPKNAIVFKCSLDGEKAIESFPADPKYIPGKNPKKK